MLYQGFPCIRIQQPTAYATIKPHTDAIYHHSFGTLNYYVPLVSRIHSGGTLQLETKPGQGDFSPLELVFGEVERFPGALVRHFTIANETGQTRVSFDTRCLPWPLYDETSAITIPPGAKTPCYQPGEYYSVAEYNHVDNKWVRTEKGVISKKNGFPF